MQFQWEGAKADLDSVYLTRNEAESTDLLVNFPNQRRLILVKIIILITRSG